MVNKLKLKAAIIEAGYTQKTLAQKTNISKNAMSAKITGKSQFTVDEAVRICDALGIDDGERKADIFLQSDYSIDGISTRALLQGWR